MSSLFYLTPHLEPPKGALAESAEALQAAVSVRDVRDMFMAAELPLFRPKLAIGGAISHYSYDAADGVWSVVLLGLELGKIDSPEALERLVVAPLHLAAIDHSLQL